ncbi:MAG: hypothetical protein ACKV19_17495 [Verrucomicrobiales bacterium]
MKDWMIRWMLVGLALGLLAEPGRAQRGGFDYARSEFVILSGGPALRRWEDLRIPNEQHDRWWGNFIRSARIRIQQIRRAHGPAARITWIVYRPSYEMRVPEDAARAADQPAAMSKIESVRDAYNLKMIYFSKTDELIRYLNSRPRRSVVNFEFFGHSNRHCFMFDYSAEISGASVVFLHESQLKRLRGNVFHPQATIRSWGCHTGESFSRHWRKAVGVPMDGALGKTDYSVIIDHVSLPRVNGRWTR